MRSCVFLLGVSLSAMSCAYGNVVGLQTTAGGTTYGPYPSINEALTTGVAAHSTTTPVLTLSGDDTETIGTTVPSTITSLSIIGSSGAIRTIIPAASLTSSLFTNPNDNPLTLNLSNLTFSGFRNDSVGGGVLYASGNGTITLNVSGPVTFTRNSAIGSGGAIFGKMEAISGPVAFTGNSSSASGGAIFNNNNNSTMTISGLATFTGNSSSVYGGGIYAGSNVTLTDTHFANNTAKTSGGAVYMEGASKTLTYNVTTSVTLGPTSPATSAAGDNDIAGVSDAMFTKSGTGTLTLNTNNLNWVGNTTVNAGRFIIGDSNHPHAQWGSSTTTETPYINSNSGTLGGYGTIYATTINLSGGTWLIGINPAGTTPPCGILTLRGGGAYLTLPANIEIDGLVGSGFPPYGYTVATGYGNSLSGSLDTLNAKLAKYNVTLTESSNPPFSLTLKELPPGVYLGSPLAQNVLVTFEVPGFYNGRAITTYGEGLVVWYGLEGPAASGEAGNFFSSGTPTSVVLNNRKQQVLSRNDANDGTINAVSNESVTPWSWTGSVALPISGLPCAWQLWTHTYGNTPAYPTNAAQRGNNWVAQGQLNLSGYVGAFLNVTHQITPGEK
ncbi:hypothetical protein [Candidatus Finniella inopinata]|uniref:Right-handed parallel beta-helix repeat-containing protein n=1 Tax=Candidatus Finniella inopinata TaxID=1696036 RepID=A0A4Q7DG91_9PROT|nr:hypothetical protein [Candidatus Finniella inopinata]RZI45672.1 hypothetical protein EQU50_06110 [Candidatus Finniella inopinata]